MSDPIQQSSLDVLYEHRYDPANQIFYPVEGTVIAVYFPDDKGNKSKREIEYDIQPLAPNFGIIRNAPLALGIAGLVDNEDILLQPTTTTVKTQGSDSADIRDHGALMDINGDRVLVQFVNGSFFNPIITHVLAHRQRTANGDNLNPRFKNQLEVLTTGATGYKFGDGSTGSTTADLAGKQGNRLHHAKMNGTHMAVDTLGNIFINFKEHPDPDKNIKAGSVTKKLVIQNEGKDFLRIEMKSGGNVEFVIAESFASKILAKIGDGAVKVAIADTLKTFYNNFKSLYDAHVHPTGTGPSGAPTAPAATWDDQIGSTKVVIPNN